MQREGQPRLWLANLVQVSWLAGEILVGGWLAWLTAFRIMPALYEGMGLLTFLLLAEVVAATAVVSEAALVYVARLKNLWLSLATIALQAVLTVGAILLVRHYDLGDKFAAAAAAGALLLALIAFEGGFQRGQTALQSGNLAAVLSVGFLQGQDFLAQLALGDTANFSLELLGKSHSKARWK